MKTILQIVTLILLGTQTTLAQIITVKPDSTGDYILIQDAIDAASNGDTVLVWPGTYYENVAIEEKNIVLGGLTLTTEDVSYINLTIINGNQTGSCIKLSECPDTCIINGFTLTNGSGTLKGDMVGGGLFGKGTNIKLINCEIHNNRTTGRGGGIYLNNSYIFLSGSTISHNHAFESGGGINFVINSALEFDTLNKCNIYLNYATEGTDIRKGSSTEPIHVVVDTFTVVYPDYYYLFSSQSSYPDAEITFEINAGKIEQVSQNIFVSNDGNNSNSGINPEEPLKDIYYALLKMKSDSVTPDTIHIANGVYSPNSGELFPIGLKKFVSLQGETRDQVILDAGGGSYIANGIVHADHYKVSKLTLQNGNGGNNYDGGIRLFENHNAIFDSLLFTNNNGGVVTSFKSRQCNSILMKNCEFYNNTGGKALRVGTNNIVPNFADTIRIENCLFIENLPDYNTEPDLGSGGAVAFIGPGGQYPDSLVCFMNNCLFVNNRTKEHPYGGASSISLSVSSGAQVHLANCTFSDNVSENFIGSNIGVTYGSKLNIYNSIMYNNDPGEIYMWTSEGEGDSYLNIYNSLVDGGEEGIRIYSGGNNIFYDDETNIDTDPVFLGKWEHPYQIADGSPCIDAGTLANLPDFIELPEYDLAGNPRIVGDSIDMGAYEWNPTVGIDKYQYQPIKENKPKLLHAAPNPFNWETSISAKWDFIGYVQIEIYNNAGLRVKVLKSGRSGGKGSIQTKWDGKDENNNILPTGIYHIVMFWGGEEVESIKVVRR